MNKKRLALVIGLLAILMAGVVYGAVLPYLSNTITATVTVESPMLVGVSLGRGSWATTECWRSDTSEWVLSFPEGVGHGGYISDWNDADWVTTGTLEIPDIRGGETITLYTMSANLADAEIKGHEEIIVENWDGITCNDFELITSRFDSIYGDLGYGKLHTDVGGTTTDCYNIDAYHIELWSPTDTSTWGAGETDVAMWHITFKANAYGTYTFSYRIVPVS